MTETSYTPARGNTQTTEPCQLDYARNFTETLVAATPEQLDALVLTCAVSHSVASFTTVPRLLAVSDDAGSGKGHPHGTGILTPAGYVPVENLKPGNQVISSDGRPTEVTNVYRRGVLPVYRVAFNDGTSVRVDGDHLWQARTKNHTMRNTPFKAVPTRDLASLLHRAWEIPQVSAPVQMLTRELPIDPYVMGVLLGDGTFYDNAIRFDTGEDATPAEVAKRLPENHSIKHAGKGYSISADVVTSYVNYRPPNKVLNATRELGLAGTRSCNKFVPETYLYASESQRLDLLRGLMDTDGELYTNTVGFSSASETLTDQVMFLVQSFGGTARKTVKRGPKYTYNGEKRTGQDSYRLTINIPVNPFLTREGWAAYTHYKPKRIIKSITPDGTADVTCIRVAANDHLYLTEHCIVTHNSTAAIHVPRMLAWRPWCGNNATEPAVKAKFIEGECTLLVDEISKLFGESGMNGKQSKLYAVLVAGYESTSVVSFSAGRVTEDVPIYGVAFMAGLRKAAPDDLRSRCIIVQMKPASGATAERLDDALDPGVRAAGTQIGKALHAWVRQNNGFLADYAKNGLRGIHPKLTGRRKQVWGPLFSVAAAAGGTWPQRCLRAFLELALDEGERPVLVPEQQMLLDFADYADGTRQAEGIVFSRDLLTFVKSLDREMYRPMSDRDLAKLMALALGSSQAIRGAYYYNPEASAGETHRGWYASEHMIRANDLRAMLNMTVQAEVPQDEFDEMTGW